MLQHDIFTFYYYDQIKSSSLIAIKTLKRSNITQRYLAVHSDYTTHSITEIITHTRNNYKYNVPVISILKSTTNCQSICHDIPILK